MFKHFERPTTFKQQIPHARRAVTVLFVAIVSILAGALGAALVSSYFVGVGDLYRVVSFLQENKAGRDASTDVSASFLQSVERQRALLVRHRLRVGTYYETLVDPADIVGQGLILTSDGWIVSPDQVTGAIIDVLIEGKSYTVQKQIADPFTRLSFIKIEAGDLIPAEISTRQANYGERMITIALASNGQRLISDSLVLQPRYLVVNAKNDYALPSGDLKESIFMSESMSGSDSILYTQRGEFAGVMRKDKQAGIVDARYIAQALQTLLRTGSVTRSDLGIWYLDRTDDHSVENQGIIVFHPTSNPVRAKSIAEKAGLQKNDILLGINGERITFTEPFQYLWGKYSESNSLYLTVIRAGKEIVLEVKK